MPHSRIFLSLLVVAILGSAVFLSRGLPVAGPVQAEAEDPAQQLGSTMVEAAKNLLAGLFEPLKAKAVFALDDPERINWHYYPIKPEPRKGAVLKEMTAKEKDLVKALLRSGTSEGGYKTTLGVISLENILRDIENTDWAKKYRDSELYYVSIFGKPAMTGKWAWRIEGHHLALNYLLEDGQVIANTPIAYGANPHEVPSGPHKGLKVLGKEEDIARTLYTSLTPDFRKKATIAETAPFDVLSEVKPQPKPLPLQGVTHAELNVKQRQLLEDLLEVHAGRQPPDVARQMLKEVRDAGMAKVHFGWSGPAEPGQPHYYRIQGPTFVVEYCNAQHNANHSHMVWRSYAGDFGFKQ